MKIKKLVKSSTEAIDIDVNDVYYNKVKTIYSKIVKYATLAQSKFKLKTSQQEAIANVKFAARDIVEAIKNTRGLQANVDKYMVSDNEHIAKEYNSLRKKASRVLRAAFITHSDKNPEKYLSQLEKIKEKVSKSDVLVDGTLDKLIRKNLISSEMASSLANDSDNVASISKNLINVAELLYIHKDTLLEAPTKKKKKDSEKKKSKKKD
jgi:phosphate:Na+ symporter